MPLARVRSPGGQLCAPAALGLCLPIVKLLSKEGRLLPSRLCSHFVLVPVPIPMLPLSTMSSSSERLCVDRSVADYRLGLMGGDVLRCMRCDLRARCAAGLGVVNVCASSCGGDASASPDTCAGSTSCLTLRLLFHLATGMLASLAGAFAPSAAVTSSCVRGMICVACVASPPCPLPPVVNVRVGVVAPPPFPTVDACAPRRRRACGEIEVDLRAGLDLCCASWRTNSCPIVSRCGIKSDSTGESESTTVSTMPRSMLAVVAIARLSVCFAASFVFCLLLFFVCNVTPDEYADAICGDSIIDLGAEVGEPLAVADVAGAELGPGAGTGPGAGAVKS